MARLDPFVPEQLRDFEYAARGLACIAAVPMRPPDPIAEFGFARFIGLEPDAPDHFGSRR